MIRFHEDSGNLAVTTLGRVASHFYIQHESVETFNDMLKPTMTDAKIVDIVCHAQVRFGGPAALHGHALPGVVLLMYAFVGPAV